MKWENGEESYQPQTKECYSQFWNYLKQFENYIWNNAYAHYENVLITCEIGAQNSLPRNLYF